LRELKKCQHWLPLLMNCFHWFWYPPPRSVFPRKFGWGQYFLFYRRWCASLRVVILFQIILSSRHSVRSLRRRLAIPCLVTQQQPRPPVPRTQQQHNNSNSNNLVNHQEIRNDPDLISRIRILLYQVRATLVRA
jgi:hypothetical protein